MRGLFVGLSCLDIIYYQEGELVENQKHYADNQIIVPGGMALNASIAFSGLGGESFLHTRIGKTHLPFIKSYLSSIDQDLVIDDYQFPGLFEFPISTVVVNIRNGSRTIINRPYTSLSQSQQSIDPTGVNVVMIDGFYPELALGTSQLANKLGIPVIMDSGSWKSGMEKLLESVNYLIVSASFSPPNCNSLTDTLNFLKQFNFKGVAITNGGEEVLAYQNNKEFKLHPTKISCVDSLGAGDILHGAFCYNFTKSGDFLSSLEFGMQIASTSCLFNGPHDWIKHN